MKKAKFNIKQSVVFAPNCYFSEGTETGKIIKIRTVQNVTQTPSESITSTNIVYTIKYNGITRDIEERFVYCDKQQHYLKMRKKEKTRAKSAITRAKKALERNEKKLAELQEKLKAVNSAEK